MKILLPPSESKNRPSSGAPLELDKLSFPALNEVRTQVIESYMQLSTREDALEILGLSERFTDDVLASASLLAQPCAPAYTLYNGVLYDALSLREGEEVYIFSGLFGLTSASDLIPSYKLSMAHRLPDLGALGTLWKKALRLGTGIAPWWPESWEGETFLDLRSSTYQVWMPQGKVYHVQVRRGGKVVSHMAKHYRGQLARLVLDHPGKDLLEVAAQLGNVSLQEARSPKGTELITLTIAVS